MLRVFPEQKDEKDVFLKIFNTQDGVRLCTVENGMIQYTLLEVTSKGLERFSCFGSDLPVSLDVKGMIEIVA